MEHQSKCCKAIAYPDLSKPKLKAELGGDGGIVYYTGFVFKCSKCGKPCEIEEKRGKK